MIEFLVAVGGVTLLLLGAGSAFGLIQFIFWCVDVHATHKFIRENRFWLERVIAKDKRSQ